MFPGSRNPRNISSIPSCPMSRQSIGKSGNHHLLSISLTFLLHSWHLRSLIQTHPRSFNDFRPPPLLPPPLSLSTTHHHKRSIYAHIPNALSSSICIIHPSIHPPIFHFHSPLHPQYLHETRKKRTNRVVCNITKSFSLLAPFCVQYIFFLFYYSLFFFGQSSLLKLYIPIHYHSSPLPPHTLPPPLHCLSLIFFNDAKSPSIHFFL